MAKKPKPATACPFCYIMLDDGVKAAGAEETDVKVADIAIHLLDAIEAGDRALATLSAPIAVGTVSVGTPVAGASAAASAPAAVAVADDLRLILGIGPKNMEILNDAGVTTFEQLAGLTVDQIQEIMPDTQDARVEREDWIGQARRFADAKAAGIDPATIAEDNQV